MAQRSFVTHPLVVRRLSVLRTRLVTPRMLRVTLTGEQLSPFEAGGATQPAFSSPAFDDHVKLVFAADGDVDAAAPVQLAHGIEWTRSASRVTRDYTPRRVTDEELDLDFVLHGDGPAASWARTASAGDTLCVVGPKSSTVVPDGLDWAVVAGDETALPAIGRFLEERPTGAPVRVVVAVEHPSARQELALREGDSIVWTDADGLEAAIRSVAPREGAGYLWAAAESVALLPVRRFATRELGLPRSHVNVTGYWRAEEETAVAPLPDALPWASVRAALRIGLVDALADGPRLRAEIEAPGDVVSLLTGPLTAAGVLSLDGDVLALGPAGIRLLEDEHLREGFDGFGADLVLSLASAMPEGAVSPWAARAGRSLHEQSLADTGLRAELLEHSASLGFLLPGLLAADWWADVERVALTGPGAPATLQAIADAGIAAEATIVDEEEWIDDLREEAGSLSVAWSASPVDADVVVAARSGSARTDAELRELLAAHRGAAPRLVLVEATAPDALSPAAARAMLLDYAATGAAGRDAASLAAIARSAGWEHERTIAIGWGHEALVFRAA